MCTTSGTGSSMSYSSVAPTKTNNPAFKKIKAINTAYVIFYDDTSITVKDFMVKYNDLMEYLDYLI